MNENKMSARVKIGPQTFNIIIREDLHQEDGKKLDGWIKFSESNIYLDSRLDPFAYKQVLWHEIIHGLLTQSGVTNIPEESVDSLSYGIMSILQDNEWLKI